MKEESLSTKSLLLDIGAMRNQAQALLERGKPYGDLLRTVLRRDFYYKEEEPIPALKELCAETGLSTGKVKKLLAEVYFDLTQAEEGLPVFLFTKQRYEFLLHARGEKYHTFTAACLPVLPRVGENISVPFFSTLLGTSRFYVEDISYELEDDTQVIYLHLRHGYFNAYWHLRKAKAEEQGELTYRDLIDLEESEWKRKLMLGDKGKPAAI